MNKRQIIASLNNIANSLDNLGLYSEANTLSLVMKRVAQTAQPEQDESNIMNWIPFGKQFNKIFMQIFNNFKKISPIMKEINRKRDLGSQLLQSQNGFQSIMMCNNILRQNKTLQTQLQNVFNQLQKLMNRNSTYDQNAIISFQKSLNASQVAIYQWSEVVKEYNLSMNQYQPNQPQAQQQPVQAPE